MRLAIFGATSAIAEHVARLYAGHGATMFLVARNGERLETMTRDLEVRGAQSVSTHTADLSDVSDFEPLIAACEKAIGMPDRVLVAYGTLPKQEEMEQQPQLAAQALHTNFVSPAVLLNVLANRMQKGSAIAVITSVAGERGRQSNYVYGAAKGGLSRFLEGLRHRLAPKGIRVIDVRPGFVDTPMTDGMDKKGPLWARPERVARDIERALEGKDGPIHTPWFWGGIMAIITRVPARIFHKTQL